MENNNSKTTAFEYQLEILKVELNQIDSAIRQMDDITKSIKDWAIVTWAASMGASFQIQDLGPYVGLTAIIPLLFWFVDARYRQIQRSFIYRLNQISDFLNGYLFSWDDIPGNDNEKLKDSLQNKYDIDWVKTAKIEKIDDGKIIKVSDGENSLSLKLSKEKINVNLEIDDGRTDKFSTKIEDGKLNIYDESKLKKSFDEQRLINFRLLDPRAKKSHDTDYKSYISIRRTLLFGSVRYLYSGLMLISLLIYFLKYIVKI